MKTFTKLTIATLLGVLMIGSTVAQNRTNALEFKSTNTRSETINETFDSGMPGDWTVVDNGSSDGVTLWEVVDDYDSKTLDGTPFAFINSDAAGSGTVLDAYLVSPVIDNSSANNVILQFTQNFQYVSDDFSAVEVWNGSEWIEVLKQEEDIPNTPSTSESWNSPVDVTLDLTAYKNAGFQVRFHYYGTWDWYWAIDNVVISEEGTLPYPLYIAGIQVDEDNASDLSVIEGVSGTINYDNDTKTLTLDNVTINTTDNMAIKNENITDLEIKLIGNNNLTSENNLTLSLKANTEINGSGSLMVTTNWDNAAAAAIDISNGSVLTIKDCNVEALSEKYGIAGWTNGESLVINNAVVKATGTENVSIGAISNLTLINCSITTPEGAAFDEDLNGVALDGSLVTEQVIIEPFNGIQKTEMLGVSVYPNPALDFIEISIDNANVKGLELQIYDMLGKLIQSKTITEQTTQLNIKNLQKGVYILKVGNNTQRFVKR